MTEPIITLADLAVAAFLDYLDVARIRADVSVHLGRPLLDADADGLSMAGWAALPCVDGRGLSLTTHNLSRAMFKIDRLRWMRAFADVLDAALPADADPRSRAVIPALRSGAVSGDVAGAAGAAAAEAELAGPVMAHAADMAAWAAGGANAGNAYAAVFAVGSARRCSKADIRAILLNGWEKQA